MAEVMLQNMLPEKRRDIIDISSAGTDAIEGNTATPEAIQAMEMFGIDLSNHRARVLNKNMAQNSELILVMERGHLEYIGYAFPSEKHKVRMLGEFFSTAKLNHIPDPYGSSLNTFKDCALMMKNCLEGVVKYFLLRR